MQYAIVKEKKVKAFPGGKGTCPMCNSDVIAKCGSRIVHHWAHHRLPNCDPWWENETEWHRDWKNKFPEECQEISQIATNGEIHRADVKTPTGIIIEFQHSSIHDIERLSRETFYKNLIWVVDGSSFQKNFDLYHMLPDPNSELAGDLVWAKAKRHMNGANHGLFFRLSQEREYNPKITKAELNYGQVYSIESIKQELEDSYNGYHQYDWIRPRQTWLNSTCPVYLDFGEEFLYHLCTYDDSGLQCVRLVTKRKFIHDVMIETDANNVATKFYPFNP